jgi:hypothetical protein
MPIPLPTPVSDSRAKALSKSSDGNEQKDTGKDKGRWDKRASRKAPPPPTKRPRGVGLAEPFPELTRQARREEAMGEKGEKDEYEMDEVEWERIKTLPRVRLVPPEGQLPCFYDWLSVKIADSLQMKADHR